MKISVIKGTELGFGDVAHWRAIQHANSDLASPYFCPEFTQAVAAVRDDVFVGILEKDGEVVGYFPHQRRHFGMGYPVGGVFSDFHGVIATPGLAWSAAALLRGCNLVSWQFDHLLASQRPFASYFTRTGESHYLDLSEGFDAYATHLQESGSGQLAEVAAKRRRLKREFENVQFVPHVKDPSLLETLIRWKSKQYQSAGLSDKFAYPWTVDLLHRIHGTQGDHFAGMLSALYFDGQLAAVHMGMRSDTVWNWWFPRHDERFAKHSPGILLRVYAAEHAPTIGIKRIDLGLGDEKTYKPRLRSGGIRLAEGRVEVPSMAVTVHRWRQEMEEWIRQTPLEGIARAPGRLLRRIEKWYELQ
jgi:CelD/BcsL family acetyltransferase involved in cellulose biosynthesis